MTEQDTARADAKRRALRKLIARGVALLDEKACKEWRAKVRLDTLRMDSGLCCVVGQLDLARCLDLDRDEPYPYPGYSNGVCVLGIAGEGDSYGFECPDDADLPDNPEFAFLGDDEKRAAIEIGWRDLDIAWTAELKGITPEEAAEEIEKGWF